MNQVEEIGEGIREALPLVGNFQLAVEESIKTRRQELEFDPHPLSLSFVLLWMRNCNRAFDFTDMQLRRLLQADQQEAADAVDADSTAQPEGECSMKEDCDMLCDKFLVLARTCRDFAADIGPSREKNRVPLFAARTLNATGQSRVSLSLQ